MKFFSFPYLFALVSLFLASCGGDNIEYIELRLPHKSEDLGAHESHYRDALVSELRSRGLSAKREVKCAGGRCDILTDKYAIEIDRASKWHEAIGQAVHYSITLKRKPCIALFDFHKLSTEKREALKSVCAKLGIKIIFIYTTPVKTAQSQNTFGRRSFQQESQNTCSPVFAGNFL